MEPVSFGRKMGIGMRLASKSLLKRTAGAPQSTPPAYSRPSSSGRTPPVAKARTTARGIAKGTKRFGEAIWGPMAHTSGVLWLEITGLFFALFTLFFAQNVYKLRFAYASGLQHRHFVLYSAVTLLFAYFTFESFYKARRKEKKQRAKRTAR